MSVNLQHVVETLRGEGLPVLYAGDDGKSAFVAFQLQDAPAKYVVRCPSEHACAEWFRRAYEIVA
jgi:hypothetical protein